MSRCWDVANFCPLVVFVAGVRIAGVRVVEFGSKAGTSGTSETARAKPGARTWLLVDIPIHLLDPGDKQTPGPN